MGETYSKAFLTMAPLSAKLPVMKRLKMKSKGLVHVQSFSKSSIFPSVSLPPGHEVADFSYLERAIWWDTRLLVSQEFEQG